MSLARLVITAVTVEGRSKSAVARDYGITRFWVQTLVKRFEVEGEAAYEPHSRRPHTNPRAVSLEVEDQIVRLRICSSPKPGSAHGRRSEGISDQVGLGVSSGEGRAALEPVQLKRVRRSSELGFERCDQGFGLGGDGPTAGGEQVHHFLVDADQCGRSCPPRGLRTRLASQDPSDPVDRERPRRDSNARPTA
jgi:hypothetical protein